MNIEKMIIGIWYRISAITLVNETELWRENPADYECPSGSAVMFHQRVATVDIEKSDKKSYLGIMMRAVK